MRIWAGTLRNAVGAASAAARMSALFSAFSGFSAIWRRKAPYSSAKAANLGSYWFRTASVRAFLVAASRLASSMMVSSSAPMRSASTWKASPLIWKAASSGEGAGWAVIAGAGGGGS